MLVLLELQFHPLPLVMTVGVDAAGAKAKKLSYEDAFAKCKKEIDANAPGGDTITSAGRYSAGGACMRRCGYRLKK
jgi:hypothetical protein